MLQRLAPWLVGPRLPLAVALLSVLLCLPALGTGFVMDDWYQRAVLFDLPALAYVGEPWRELFCFMPGPGRNGPLVEVGILPWWADTDVRACFLRPLASVLHQLDSVLWRDQAWLQHAHSLAWWGLAAWLVARFYRQVLPGSLAAAGLAALLFAIEDDHAMVIGWIAGRNGLLALVFGMLCIGLHLRGRLLWAMLAAAAGLLVGEPFIGALGYIVAWEVTRTGPLRERGSRVLPYALLLAGWRLWYQAEGFGASASGLYVDPGRQPLRFLSALVERGPWLAAGQSLGLPVDAWIFLDRPLQLAVAAGSVVALTLLVPVLAPLLRGSRQAAFLLLGSLLSLVPPCGAFPTARLMMWAGVGFFGLLGLAADRAGLLSGQGTGWRRRAVAILVGGHLVLGVVFLPGRILLWPMTASTFHVGALHAPDDPALVDQTLVYVNGSELMAGYTGLIRVVIARTRAERGYPQPGPYAPRRVTLLSSMMTAAGIDRVDAHTLRITPDGGFLATTMDQMFRGEDATFERGQVLSTPDLDATVVALTEDGRPASAELRFHEPLDSGAYRFVFFERGELVDWAPPAVGRTTRVEATLPRPDLRPLGALGP